MPVSAALASYGAAGDITTGLYLWWKFDEGTGTSTTADSGSGGNAGSLNNSPSWVTGMIGPYALDFNGTNQFVKTTVAILQSGIVTVACWFKKDTSNFNRRFIAFNSNGGSMHMFAANGATGGSGAATVHILDGGGNGKVANCSDGVWHHGVGIYNQATGTLVSAYLDGVLMTSASGAFAGDGGNGLKVATRGTESTFYKGSVDDVRLYSRGLTALDVAALYAYR